MRVLWARGRATVREVVQGLEGRRKPAYNTVLTLLRILDRKGYVRHEKVGRAFVYEPRIGRRQAQQRAVQHLLRRFFDNSPEQLVVNLIERGHVDLSDRDKLRALPREAKSGETP
jgi:predicted transcriptional regulator